MTSFELAHLTDTANRIGKPAGLQCKYEYDRKTGKFVWNFYRRRGNIGTTKVASTSIPNEVVKKMTRLVTTTEGETK